MGGPIERRSQALDDPQPRVADRAAEILSEGSENRGDFLTRSVRPRGGVWLSDKPLPWRVKAVPRIVLSVEIPDYVVAEFEQPMKQRGIREFLVPAEVVNQHCPPKVVVRDDRRRRAQSGGQYSFLKSK